MKNIRKIVALVIAAVMMFSLAACSSSDSETTTEDSNKLVMATSADFPPYEYMDGDDIVGIDAEIAAALAAKLGMEIEIVNVDFDSVIAGVSTGKYDLGMAGITKTEEREKSVNFTDPYTTAVQSIVVLEGSDITSMDDFYTTDANGNKITKEDLLIGVQTSTTGDIYLSDDVENDGVGKDHVVEYKTGADAIQALKTGKVNAVVIDNEPAKAFVEANEGLKILETPYVEEQYAIAMNKDDEELYNKVNTALNELISDGSVQRIIDKYITD